MSTKKRVLPELENPTDSAPAAKKSKIETESSVKSIESRSLSTADALDELSNILADVRQPVNLTTGGKSTLPLIPELCVDGIGRIPLPICEQQLELLLAKCQKSQFGHGMENESNDAVRCCHELNADQFGFSNPGWEKSMGELVKSVCIELGCAKASIPNVGAHVYKLLVYIKDGHFLAHRDTQKQDGMFATLVVQLPSIYETDQGMATLTVTHRQQEHEYYFGQNEDASQYHIFYAAHYCDLSHRINKIKSGVRMAVVYNLCWNGPRNMKPEVGELESFTDSVREVISCWKDSTVMALNLEHLYTQEELNSDGRNALKGNDAIKIELLAQNEGLQFFFVQLERTVSETVSRGRYYGGEEISREQTFPKQWIDSDGQTYDAQYMDIDLEQVCIGYCDDDDGWAETNVDEEEYYGNAAPTRDTTYQKCVAIWFKKERELEIMLASKRSHDALQRFFQANGKQKALHELQKIITNLNGIGSARKCVLPILAFLTTWSEVDLIEMLIHRLIEAKVGLIHIKEVFVIIEHFGWTEQVKSAILKWLEIGLANEDSNRIEVYCQFVQLITQKKNEESKNNNEDDDVVILDQKEETELKNQECNWDECFADVSTKVLDGIFVRLDLDNDAQPLNDLNQKNIESILQFIAMMILNGRMDTETQTLFASQYNQHLSKKSVVFEICKQWKNQAAVIQSVCFQSIIQHQLDILSKALPQEPVFTWVMPADGVQDVVFKNFLLSNQQQFAKRGFTGIVKAREWATRYENSRPVSSGYLGYNYAARRGRSTNAKKWPYTVTLTATGTGKNSRVDVAKNPNKFNEIKAVYDQKLNEVKSLSNCIKNSLIWPWKI